MAVATSQAIHQTSGKVSSSEIMAQFESLGRKVANLESFVTAKYLPKPLLIYKPNDRDTTKGSALRLNYRAIVPKGGAFLDLSGQKPGTDENGNSHFNWDRKEEQGTALELLTTKLGIPDIQALLLGYQYKRTMMLPTPVSIRSIGKDTSGKWLPENVGDTVGLIHKNQSGTTILEWKFTDTGSYLRLVKLPSVQRRSISLTLAEELSLVLYLSKALDAFLEVGVR